MRDAVKDLFAAAWPQMDFVPVARAFQDFELAFTGRMPGYFGVDTIYHDQQHTLDVTLAMARLVAGFEHRHAGTEEALGVERGRADQGERPAVFPRQPRERECVGGTGELRIASTGGKRIASW